MKRGERSQIFVACLEKKKSRQYVFGDDDYVVSWMKRVTKTTKCRVCLVTKQGLIPVDF